MPSKNKVVDFLFDPRNKTIIECDMDGRPLSHKKWQSVTPQQFAKKHWGKRVSALSQIHVQGYSLTEFKGEPRDCAKRMPGLPHLN